MNNDLILGLILLIGVILMNRNLFFPGSNKGKKD